MVALSKQRPFPIPRILRWRTEEKSEPVDPFRNASDRRPLPDQVDDASCKAFPLPDPTHDGPSSPLTDHVHSDDGPSSPLPDQVDDASCKTFLGEVTDSTVASEDRSPNGGITNVLAQIRGEDDIEEFGDAAQNGYDTANEEVI
ncbi:hypothetical protein K7X08_022245 [Anisodus acutangulus]|uniref:Uncharacterized protein n=1 Tax=Anisodus acutangulus TaxID=402998 RepID=A0A9Q1QV42_9SOLA|nr:hypothetical protein K7X08_022245 [Anisodus acutangulus]